MSWRGTLVLALLAGAAVFVAYDEVVTDDPAAGWSSVLKEPLPPPPGSDLQSLIDIKPESVTRLTLSHSGTTAETVRTADGWTGTSKPGAVDDFIESVAKLAVILRIDKDPSAEDLEAYGLAQPADVITLIVADQPPITIALGHHNPPLTGIYALLSPSNEIVLTGAVAVWEVGKVVNALAPAD